MVSKKKLTIGLPTYNRLNYVKKQLSFFKGEIKNNKEIQEKVNFIVADNASTDQTPLFLSDYKSKNDFFDYVINPSNLGLVGNVVKLLDLSTTEYVWFVSDDDDLAPGIVTKVLEILVSNPKIEFIFLNYSFFNRKGFMGKTGLRFDSKKATFDVFREHYGSLVLITACVHKRKNLNELSSNSMFKWLSGPLLYSFFSGTKGPIYLTEDIWINYRTGDASYAGFKTISKLKFEEYVPILESLPKFGYDKNETKKTIQIFFQKQSHAHLLYIGINFKNALRLYKYYTFKAILNMPLHILQYTKRIIS